MALPWSRQTLAPSKSSASERIKTGGGAVTRRQLATAEAPYDFPLPLGTEIPARGWTKRPLRLRVASPKASACQSYKRMPKWLHQARKSSARARWSTTVRLPVGSGKLRREVEHLGLGYQLREQAIRGALVAGDRLASRAA